MDNQTDTGVVKLVVLGLFLIAIVGLVGTIFLIARDTATESVAIVTGITSASVGSLATLLASTKSIDVRGLAELSRLGHRDDGGAGEVPTNRLANAEPVYLDEPGPGPA